MILLEKDVPILLSKNRNIILIPSSNKRLLSFYKTIYIQNISDFNYSTFLCY